MENAAAPAVPEEAKRILEAALLAAQEPLPLSELKRLFDNEIAADTLKNLLEELRADWSGRAVELVCLASGWRFRTRLEFQPYLERLSPAQDALGAHIDLLVGLDIARRAAEAGDAEAWFNVGWLTAQLHASVRRCRRSLRRAARAKPFWVT